MIPLAEIKKKIADMLSITYLEVIDLRGGDHIQVIIASSNFENKSLVERHKIIYDILSGELASGEVHALTIKSFTPIEWENQKGTFKKDLGHAI